MSDETVTSEKKRTRTKVVTRGGGEAVYGLGLIGAMIYYFSTATSFLMGVLGFLKAIVWPAFLVFEAMKFLGM